MIVPLEADRIIDELLAKLKEIGDPRGQIIASHLNRCEAWPIIYLNSLQKRTCPESLDSSTQESLNAVLNESPWEFIRWPDGSWGVHAGISKFLVAKGSGWSEAFGEALMQPRVIDALKSEIGRAVG